VNTVVFRDGKRFGHNTDLWGFARAFAEGIGEAVGEHVLLMGAGGAGVAVAEALLAAGVEELVIQDKDATRALELAENLNARLGPNRTHALRSTDQGGKIDGLVNATPVGMASNPGIPIDDGLLTPDIWVADIIYFPLETELLRRARHRGCRTMNGSAMAIYQAVSAFELFSGFRPDSDRMKAVLESFDREA
jgi:shikimate dehydrogenase